MPHKHTRRERDVSTYDLPPTQIARSLPVKASLKAAAPTNKKAGPGGRAKTSNGAAAAAPQGVKRKRAAGPGVTTLSKANDAPRAFRRLMALTNGKRIRSGLDDGVQVTKKAKKEAAMKAKAAAAAGEGPAEEKAATKKDEKAAQAATAAAPNDAPTIPAIRPGERLSEYAARVDAALPLSGLIQKSGKNGQQDPLGLAKVYRTKKERKMHRLYDEWREEERKLVEREAEAKELAEERDMELDEEHGVKWRLDLAAASQSKKKSKKNNNGADIWAELNRKKRAATVTTRAGVHDVAEAPPELTKIDSNKFFSKQAKAEAAAAVANKSTSAKKKAGLAATLLLDIPKSAGSLAEREELLAVRQNVLAAYRRQAESRRQKASAALGGDV